VCPVVGDDVGMSTDVAAFRSAFEQAIQSWQLGLSAEQVQQLCIHYQAMVEANAVMNLTRIVDPVEAAAKQYADSLALVHWSRVRGVAVRSLLDIGTGAGFPAFPVAVAKPEWEVVALDGTKKKIDFVARSAAANGLSNLKAIHAHSAHWESERTFDVVTTRALGSIKECLSEAAKFVSQHGQLVLFKTPEKAEVERQAAVSNSKHLRLAEMEPFPYRLSLGGEELQRVLVVFLRKPRRT
jgi:16S rRNA (guanine527-N7)-methyltransferase